MPSDKEQLTADLAEDLLDAISALRRALRRQAGAVLETAGLTNAQVQVVRAVHHHPGASVALVADELGVAPNTVSTLVRQLSDAGVLERRSGPPDRRVAQLFLSPAVAKGLGAWVGRRSGMLATALEALSPKERQAIGKALRPLARLGAQIRDNREGGVGEKGDERHERRPQGGAN